jgi:hypothetical protein
MDPTPLAPKKARIGALARKNTRRLLLAGRPLLSQVHELNRTQPMLRLAPACRRGNHMTTNGMGAPRYLRPWMWPVGSPFSNCYRRHRHQEFLRFLKDIDANLPTGFDGPLVMDNYATHKVSQVQAWLASHPRYYVHFTPTSRSWLNLVEHLFAEVTERCVRRGSHTAVRALEKAMFSTTPATAGRMMAFWDRAEVERTAAHGMSWALYRVGRGAIRLGPVHTIAGPR